MTYIKNVVCANVVCANTQQQAAAGSNKGEFGHVEYSGSCNTIMPVNASHAFS
jgi:hypothetical protein